MQADGLEKTAGELQQPDNGGAVGRGEMAFGFTHAFPKIYILCCFLLAAELGMICFRQDLGSSHGGCVFLPSEAKQMTGLAPQINNY